MICRIYLFCFITVLAGCGSGGSSEDAGYTPRTFMFQSDGLTCVEYNSLSELNQQQAEATGAVLGSCSRENALGVCEQPFNNQELSISSVYYVDPQGLITAEMVLQACSMAGGNFIAGRNISEPQTYIPTTFVIQENEIACTEHTTLSQSSHNQAESLANSIGSCSRENSLGVCERQSADILIKTVYYPDEAGLRTAESLVAGCENIGGVFIFGDNASEPIPTYIPTTFIILENEIACTENTTLSQASHNQIEFIADTIGSCSRVNTLGICERQAADILIKTVYYPDEAGLRTVGSLVAGCEHIGGTFVYGEDTFDVEPMPTLPPITDTVAPILIELVPIGNSTDLTPIYTFNSTEAGHITWSGSCTSEVAIVSEGTNVIELTTLQSGEYSDCSILVTDIAGNQSLPLIVTTFNLIRPDTDGDGFADFIEVEYETDPLNKDSTPVGMLSNLVDFSDDNDSDGFSDEIEAWYNTDPNHADSKPLDENNDLIPDNFDASTDSDAPRLLGFDIYENEVNVETGSEAVTFNLTVIDDISGVASGGIYLYSPSGQNVYADLPAESLGGLTHSLSLQSSELGEFAEAGTWSISYVVVYDVAGNSFSYGITELNALGGDTSIEVVNANSDVQAPTISAFTITEDVVNIETGSEAVTFNLTVMDDNSGVASGGIYLYSSGGQNVYADLSAESLGGLTHSLSLQSSELGEFAEAGTWSISYVVVSDVAGNSFSFGVTELSALGGDTSIEVVNANSDVQAPTISAFTITEEVVNIETGAETVTFNLTVIDDISGVASGGIYLYSSGGQNVYADLSAESLGGLTHTLSLQSSKLGEFAEAGTWSISYVVVYDVAGNSFSYGISELNALGGNTTIEVTN